MLNITELTIEYRRNPLGIDVKAPRFSWKIHSDQQTVFQNSYHLTVLKENDKSVLWDSGEVCSTESICVRCKGDAPEPKTRYTVHLSVMDNYGECAERTEWFETGLISCENMQADWITHGFEDELEPCAVFEKSFELKEKPLSARLYASALGVYEFEINGRAGSDVHLAPGWTDYHERIQYQTYDITDLLETDNIICFIVGNGWYKGILGFYNQGCHYGNRTALIAQIEVTYKNGERETIVTDESWMSTTGSVRYSEWYHGETIDYTIEEQEKHPVRLYDQPKQVLVAQQDEPVRITERISGKRCFVTPQGDVVIDFGQNLAGVVEARIHAARGTKVTVRHGEALDEKGNFFTANLRTAKATDTFICSGNEDIFHPRFTSHGFRYIAVSGLGESLNPEDFTACVWHTDLEQAGYFTCSDENVNRLWQNIDWTMRSNYIDIPTDCPQRDERMGYTGDAQLFLSTAVCFKKVPLFFEKWLEDLKIEQDKGMGVPTTIPNIMGPGGGIAIWHDAACVVPWILYETYGDRDFLERQFDSMVACVEYSGKMAGKDGLIKTGQQLGDWVSMDVPRGPMTRWKDKVWNLELTEKIGATDPYFVANVYYGNSVNIVAKAAAVLGKKQEASKYSAMYDQILSSVREEYITTKGRLVSETQTGCAMALYFDIAQPENREVILHTLLERLKERNNHLTTGFVGTMILCKVLSENGAHDVAGSVFLKEDCPSWLYSVKLGATTVWELWDGVNPDGSFNPFEMNSLNQYAYASVGDWMFHDLLGLNLILPGYKKSRIAPRLIEGIPKMSGSLETVYGTLSCEISCKNHRYTVDIHIPENTEALVSLPEREETELGSGFYHFEYETESVFDKLRYNMDTKFGELLDNPVGSAMLHQYVGELVENELFMTFASGRSITEIESMLPPEAMQIVLKTMEQCNRAENN